MVIFTLALMKFAKVLGTQSAMLRISKNNDSVSFIYDKEHCTTDDNLILIGNTKKYIILRSILDSTNYFFERDKITHLKIQKIDHKKNLTK